MGNELATQGRQYSIGKQTLASDSSSESVCVPGKATLTEALESSPSLDLARVARHAGERVVEGGFEYLVLADGSFEVTKATKAPLAKVEGRRITIERFPGAWLILHDLVLGQAPKAKPAAPAAARPVDAARPAKRPVRAERARLSPAEVATNETRIRKDKAPFKGSTLEFAKTRADLGNAGTHYDRPLAVDANVKKMWSGDKDANTFWCSGLTMWTLAAAGYDLESPVVGSDGVAFTYTTIAKAKGATAEEAEKTAQRRRNKELVKLVTAAGIVLANDEYPVPNTIKFRELIDGHALPVKVMSIVEANPQSPGRNLGVFREENAFPELIDGVDTTAAAATGAPGAFEAFGIGHIIPESDQKPGDFAQERWLNNGIQDGHGHAFQVWSVIAEGSAIFGKKGSPEPLDDNKADGWKEGVRFRITKDTDPSLVGEHRVVRASRIEANLETEFPKEQRKRGGDGGVLITDDVEVPAPERHKGLIVFYGRLGASPWSQWNKATKPSP